MAREGKETRQHKPLPAPNSDFYDVTSTLSADEQVILRGVREFLESKVAPIIGKYWLEDAFPFELLPAFKELNIGGIAIKGYGGRGKSLALMGFIQMELARVDPSISTFFGVHAGLAMGSIYLGGSDEQKQKWLPPMIRLEKIGCFGLTEPLSGSDASGGLRTTAKREGDTWVLNGAKRWIGNATFADYVVVYARDLDDNNVKGFVVENGTPGFSPVQIENKVSLRIVQNAEITLTDVRVPEANRLQNIHSFKDVAKILRFTRTAVSWMAVGVMIGAYEHALDYAK